MKTMTTALFLVGAVLTAPSFAEEANTSLKQMDSQISSEMSAAVSKNETVNPQHEEFKSYVVDALDAHKKKAPAEMKAHHEEMKAYVGKALDNKRQADDAEMKSKLAVWKAKFSTAQIETSQKEAQSKLGGVAPYAMNYQESLEYIIGWRPIGGLDSDDVAEVDSCFRAGVNTDDCITDSITAFTVAEGVASYGGLPLSLEFNCSAANCKNPIFQKACLLVDNSTWALGHWMIQHCLEQ